MKFTIQKQALIKGLAIVSKGIASYGTIEATRGILLKNTKEGLELSSSHFILSMKYTIPSEINGLTILENFDYGETLIDGKMLLAIVRKMTGETISFHVEQSKTIIHSEYSEFKLNTFDVREFPLIDTSCQGLLLMLPSETFKQLIEDTIFAVSTLESRPILTGVNFTITENTIQTIGTDSYRLSLASAPVEFDIAALSTSLTFTMPGKILKDILHIIETLDIDTISMYYNKNTIAITLPNMHMNIQLLDGSYPANASIIPMQFKHDVIVHTRELLSALGRASIIAQTGSVAISSTFTNEGVTLYVNLAEYGEVHEEVHDIKGNEAMSEPFTISFNHRYLEDALRALKGEYVRLQFNSERDPFVITSTDETSKLIELIVPIRTV